MAGSEDVWKLLCVVRGYHVYKDVWDPYLEDEFTIAYKRALSGSPHRSFNRPLATFRGFKGSSDVILRANTAEIVFQARHQLAISTREKVDV